MNKVDGTNRSAGVLLSDFEQGDTIRCVADGEMGPNLIGHIFIVANGMEDGILAVDLSDGEGYDESCVSECEFELVEIVRVERGEAPSKIEEFTV